MAVPADYLLSADDKAVIDPRHLETVERDDLEEDNDDPLDEFNDGGLFLCRWPNGGRSVVAALTKGDASFNSTNGPPNPTCFTH